MKPRRPVIPRLRGQVWVEAGGGVAMSNAGADLLEQIAVCGSLSEAARRLGFSYRRAWMLVDGMNRRWQTPRVVTAIGGERGGGTKVMEFGSLVLRAYRDIKSSSNTSSIGRAGLFSNQPDRRRSDALPHALTPCGGPCNLCIVDSLAGAGTYFRARVSEVGAVMGHNRWPGLVFAFVVTFTAASGFACPRDGTDGPCHCLQKALSVLDDVQFALAQTQQVHVFNFDFSTNPQGMPVMDATIHAGDSVHWTWDSGFHSVTSVAGSIESFDSGDLSAPSATFDHTFTHVGRITYYCNIHGFDNGNGTAGGMSGVITVLAPPGDTNDDGKVDFTDLLILAQHYGQTTTDLTTGDFNGDGKVDFTDLLTLAQHYGQADAAVSAASAVSPVPEPTLIGLIATAIPMLRRRR